MRPLPLSMRNIIAWSLVNKGLLSIVTICAVSSISERPLASKMVASADKRTRAGGWGGCSVISMTRLTDKSSLSPRNCCTIPLGQRRESTSIFSASPTPNEGKSASCDKKEAPPVISRMAWRLLPSLSLNSILRRVPIASVLLSVPRSRIAIQFASASRLRKRASELSCTAT